MSNLQAVIIWPRELASCVLGMAGKEGAVNGSQGTVYDIIYGEDQGPPSMHIAILVRFKAVIEPKDNDEVAHQQLPSKFAIRFEARMA